MEKFICFGLRSCVTMLKFNNRSPKRYMLSTKNFEGTMNNPVIIKSHLRHTVGKSMMQLSGKIFRVSPQASRESHAGLLYSKCERVEGPARGNGYAESLSGLAFCETDPLRYVLWLTVLLICLSRIHSCQYVSISFPKRSPAGVKNRVFNVNGEVINQQGLEYVVDQGHRGCSIFRPVIHDAVVGGDSLRAAKITA